MWREDGYMPPRGFAETPLALPRWKFVRPRPKLGVDELRRACVLSGDEVRPISGSLGVLRRYDRDSLPVRPGDEARPISSSSGVLRR